jgi:hypothetical protein
MIRARLLLLLALLVPAAAIGCRSPHLGPKHGKAHRDAFHKQVVMHDAQPPADQTAADAKRVLRAHQGAKETAGAAAGGFRLEPLDLGRP